MRGVFVCVLPSRTALFTHGAPQDPAPFLVRGLHGTTRRAGSAARPTDRSSSLTGHTSGPRAWAITSRLTPSGAQWDLSLPAVARIEALRAPRSTNPGGAPPNPVTVRQVRHGERAIAVAAWSSAGRRSVSPAAARLGTRSGSRFAHARRALAIVSGAGLSVLALSWRLWKQGHDDRLAGRTAARGSGMNCGWRDATRAAQPGAFFCAGERTRYEGRERQISMRRLAACIGSRQRSWRELLTRQPFS